MIVSTIDNVSQFRDEFHRCGRGKQFTYDGLEVLFDMLEDYSDSTGEPYELDVIALCCEYAEEPARSIATVFSIDIEGLDDDEVEERVESFLVDEGVFVGKTAHTMVYLQF